MYFRSGEARETRRDLLAALIVPKKGPNANRVLLARERSGRTENAALLPGFIRELTERIEACENRGR